MSHPSVPLARPVEAPEPTHPCIRCGRPGLPADRALCEYCNPLELAQPSATQVHGIAAAGIILFVVLLALLARAALSGTGPFSGGVTGTVATSGGLAVTLLVTNQGTKAAATTCRLVQAGDLAGGPSELVQTPVVPAGGEIHFTTTVTRFGTSPVVLQTSCESP